MSINTATKITLLVSYSVSNIVLLACSVASKWYTAQSVSKTSFTLSYDSNTGSSAGHIWWCTIGF